MKKINVMLTVFLIMLIMVGCTTDGVDEAIKELEEKVSDETSKDESGILVSEMGMLSESVSTVDGESKTRVSTGDLAIWPQEMPQTVKNFEAGNLNSVTVNVEENMIILGFDQISYEEAVNYLSTFTENGWTEESVIEVENSFVHRYSIIEGESASHGDVIITFSQDSELEGQMIIMYTEKLEPSN